MFACFLAKAITWSPFLGIEMYDTLFEHIYHDVQFQVNVIKPRSLTVSPSRPGKVKSSSRLAEIQEHEGEGQNSKSPETQRRTNHVSEGSQATATKEFNRASKDGPAMDVKSHTDSSFVTNHASNLKKQRAESTSEDTVDIKTMTGSSGASLTNIRKANYKS